MQKVIILSFLITFIYSIIKFIEAKYIENEFKPLKLVVRDAMVVLLSSMSCLFIFYYFENNIFDFFNMITDNKNKIISEKVDVFVDDPGF